MTNWIISANPNKYDIARSFEHYSYIDWRQKNNFQVGDIVFIYVSSPDNMVQYKCTVLDTNRTYPNIRDDKRYFKNPDEYQKSIKGKFVRLLLSEMINNSALSYKNLKSKGLKSKMQGPMTINGTLLDYISINFSDNFQKEIFPELIDDKDTLFEGIKKQILVNRYERSSMARKKCLEHHKPICAVCDMNFVQIYGEIGKDFIHIHHLIPLHKIGKEYKIDYEKDLIPVCPNCHAMLHRKIEGKEPSIEELKQMINNQIAKT